MSPNRPPQPADPLLALGQELGIPAIDWPGREKPELLTYPYVQLPSARAKSLTLSTVKKLTDAYGDALTCYFMLEGLPLLTLSSATDQTALDNFKAELDAIPTVYLELSIDKSRLLESWFGSEPLCRRFLYFFPETFGRLLTGKLGEIEKLLWGSETTGKTVVIIPGSEIWLDGLLLAVVGDGPLVDWRDAVPRTAPDTSVIKEMYRACRENLKWQEPFVGHMTPFHLQMSVMSSPRGTIANALTAQLLNLVLLYTADRTGTNDRRQTIATFEGAGQTAGVPIPDPAVPLLQTIATFEGVGQTVRVPFLDPAEPLPEQLISTGVSLKPLVEWVYEPRWVADRLAQTQVAMAEALGSIDVNERPGKLLEGASNILGNLRWHWKAFIEGKIDNYDAQVRTLEDYVGDTVKSYADQIGEMIKGLSETMLAAIAAVLGSFLVAVFGDKFDPLVFSIGMICYAVYVAAFPLGYNMLSQWERYGLLREQFQHRKKRIEQVLPPEKVEDTIAGQVAASEHRFERWFWLTIGAYLIVILLSIASALIVPSIMKDAPSATATVTSSTSPIATPAP